MTDITEDLMKLDDIPSSDSISTAIADTIQPSLQKAYLSPEAFHFCLTQCLSTEVEEVMGLLIGELDDQNGYCYITHALPLKRLDKRKDRVEIGIEQLSLSFTVVDELNTVRNTNQTENTKQLNVIGWYHSHPHITVFPSEVDIATHHQYQSQLSPFWLGLIFGVFNYEDSSAMNRLQLIGFKSTQTSTNGRASLKHTIVPITIDSRPSPAVDQWTLMKKATLIDLLFEEEKEAYLLNQGPQSESREVIGSHYNACVYSKAVAKIIALLGAPMLDTLRDKREKLVHMKEMLISGH